MCIIIIIAGISFALLPDTLVLQPSKHYGLPQRKREDHHSQTIPCEWLVLLFWSAALAGTNTSNSNFEGNFFPIDELKVLSIPANTTRTRPLQAHKLHCTVRCCLRVRVRHLPGSWAQAVCDKSWRITPHCSAPQEHHTTRAQ